MPILNLNIDAGFVIAVSGLLVALLAAYRTNKVNDFAVKKSEIELLRKEKTDEVDLLRQELERLQKKVAAQDTEITELRAENKTLHREINKLEDKNADLQREIGGLQNERDALKERVKQLEKLVGGAVGAVVES